MQKSACIAKISTKVTGSYCLCSPCIYCNHQNLLQFITLMRTNIANNCRKLRSNKIKCILREAAVFVGVCFQSQSCITYESGVTVSDRVFRTLPRRTSAWLIALLARNTTSCWFRQYCSIYSLMYKEWTEDSRKCVFSSLRSAHNILHFETMTALIKLKRQNIPARASPGLPQSVIIIKLKTSGIWQQW